MQQSREEQIQSIIEKIRCVLKNSHKTQGFPLGDFKMGRTQIHILMFLRRSKSSSVKELAQFLGVTSGAVTQLIDSLIEKGMVQREEDSQDRRTLRISLTPSAEKKFQKFKNEYFKSLVPMFDALNDTELSKLQKMIEKIKIPSRSNLVN